MSSSFWFLGSSSLEFDQIPSMAFSRCLRGFCRLSFVGAIVMLDSDYIHCHAQSIAGAAT